MNDLADQMPVIAEAIVCGARDWSGIWGDPLLSGSLFMFSYGLAAVVMLKVSRLLAGRERLLWAICGYIFLFQVANTNLDLHAFIFTFGRCLAHAQGWYEDRRAVQALALIAAAICAMVVLFVLILLFRKHMARNSVMILGVAVALGMTVTKGINHHGLEAYYGHQIGPFRGADLIELSGIAIALTAALIRLGSLKRRARAGTSRSRSGTG